MEPLFQSVPQSYHVNICYYSQDVKLGQPHRGLFDREEDTSGLSSLKHEAYSGNNRNFRVIGPEAKDTSSYLVIKNRKF